jgi:hypothetical protein
MRISAMTIEKTPVTIAPSGLYFDPRHKLLQFQGAGSSPIPHPRSV